MAGNLPSKSVTCIRLNLHAVAYVRDCLAVRHELSLMVEHELDPDSGNNSLPKPHGDKV